MLRLLIVPCAFCFFLFAPYAERLPPAWASLLLVALGVALAVAASGSTPTLTIAAGAAGAFCASLLGSFWIPLAGACLVAFAFGERTLRVRSRPGKLIHCGAALLAGGLGQAIQYTFQDGPTVERGVSLLVAAILVSLPLLIPADDPTTHELRQIALRLPAPLREALEQAVALRRSGTKQRVQPGLAKGIQATWKSLLLLSRARLGMELSPQYASADSSACKVREAVDRRLLEHVRVLARAQAATEAVAAAQLGIQTGALRETSQEGALLEETGLALIELETSSKTPQEAS